MYIVLLLYLLYTMVIYIYICNKVEFVYTLLRQRPVEYNNDNLI